MLSKKEQGITLIALVITIVILIILATVAINAIFRDGGLIEQAELAKDLYNNGAKQEEEGMTSLAGQLNGLITEVGGSNEEDPSVKIIISKTPDTELAEEAKIKVEDVEGIDDIKIEDIDISKMDEELKKDLIKNIMIQLINIQVEGKECNSIEDVLEIISSELGVNITEEYLWQMIEEDMDKYLQDRLEELKQAGIKTIKGYKVINPVGKESLAYVAEKNGTYTFKVKELYTDRIFTKTVDINNIKEYLGNYYVKEKEEKIVLVKDNQDMTDFQKIYFIYNDERINVSYCIQKEEYTFVDISEMILTLEEMGKVTDRSELLGTVQKIEIVKNEKSYFGDIMLLWAE